LNPFKNYKKTLSSSSIILRFHCKKVCFVDIIEKSIMVSFSGGHKLFDAVNKPPSSPTPISKGVASFCRGAPKRGHKKQWPEEYFA